MSRVSNTSYIRHAPYGTDSNPAPCGGDVIWAIGTVALNVGEEVYWDGTTYGSVTKSATVGNYTNKIAGVVVGGRSTGYEIVDTLNQQGLPACAAGQEVIVQFNGVCYVGTNASGALVNVVVGPSTTSGRVVANSTAGQILGVFLETAVGNAFGRVVLGIH